MTSGSPDPDWPHDASDARRLLGVSADADARAIRKAWRARARRHHPDRGGDTTTFLALQAAYQVLIDQPEAPPPADRGVARGTPSRHARTTAAPPASFAWDRRPPTDGEALDADAIAILIGVSGHGRVLATSRAPGSRLNRWASQIWGPDAATLSIRPNLDDRGRVVCQVTITARTRAARRALESAGLPDSWLRRRTPSATTLTVARPLDDRGHDDGGTTAVSVARSLDDVLRGAGWPLRQWFHRTPPDASSLSNPRAR